MHILLILASSLVHLNIITKSSNQFQFYSVLFDFHELLVWAVHSDIILLSLAKSAFEHTAEKKLAV